MYNWHPEKLLVSYHVLMRRPEGGKKSVSDDHDAYGGAHISPAVIRNAIANYRCSRRCSQALADSVRRDDGWRAECLASTSAAQRRAEEEQDTTYLASDVVSLLCTET